MPPVKAIAFDAFGTLIQFGGPRLNPYARLLSARAGIDRTALLTRNVSASTIATDFDLIAELPAFQAELAAELSGLQLFGEVPEILDKARVAGLRLAVCSNLAYEYGPTVRRLLPDLDSYVLSFETGVPKPHPTMFRLVSAELGCMPDEVVFVGDSKRCDVDGPRAFGMQARWLNRETGETLIDVLDGVV